MQFLLTFFLFSYFCFQLQFSLSLSAIVSFWRSCHFCHLCPASHLFVSFANLDQMFQWHQDLFMCTLPGVFVCMLKLHCVTYVAGVLVGLQFLCISPLACLCACLNPTVWQMWLECGRTRRHAKLPSQWTSSVSPCFRLGFSLRSGEEKHCQLCKVYFSLLAFGFVSWVWAWDLWDLNHHLYLINLLQIVGLLSSILKLS